MINFTLDIVSFSHTKINYNEIKKQQQRKVLEHNGEKLKTNHEHSLSLRT